MVKRIEYIISRIDADLLEHFEHEQVTVLQLVFRWINCLLSRELNMTTLFRCYDALLAEECGLYEFLIYVCSALLKRMSNELKQLEFQELMTLMSTASLSLKMDCQAMDAILAEAFVLKSLFPPSTVD